MQNGFWTEVVSESESGMTRHGVAHTMRSSSCKTYTVSLSRLFPDYYSRGMYLFSLASCAEPGAMGVMLYSV